MTHKMHLFAIAAAAGFASTAHAQGISFDGANIQGEYISSSSSGAFDYSQTGVYGAAQVSMGRFAVQADLGTWEYDSDPWVDMYYDVHAMYKISPNFVAGGYFGQDLWNNGNLTYSTFGVETKFTPGFLNGRLTFEAFAGVYRNDANPTTGTNPMIGLGATYAVNDRIDLGVSYLRGAWDDLSVPANQYDVLELESTYSLANGIYATASYTSTFYIGSNQDDTLGIAVGFNFGNGVTFERRGYTALYPGD